jgi:hypothetical protein
VREGEQLVFTGGRGFLGVFLAGLLIAGIAAVVPATPASAQNLFDFLFGSPRRQGPPPSANSYTDPFPSFNPFGNRGDQDRRTAPPSGGATAFCVRLCDGRYFPIQRVKGASAAQMCNSFCPASATKVFSGGPIDHSVASDGSRYNALPNAFAYRERKVDDCTCNGRDPYGLVAMDVNEDPTLRAGDIVATDEGFVVFNAAANRRHANFTPIGTYGGLSAEFRERLAQTRIVPRNATPVSPEALRSRAAAIQDERDRRVQLDR